MNIQEYIYRQRANSLIIIVIIASSLLIARLFFLQIVENKKFAKMSEKNQLTFIPHEASRGIIFDRNNKILAYNLPIYQLQLIPQLAKKPKEILQKLLNLNIITNDDINNYHKKSYLYRPYEPITIKENISEVTAAIIAENTYQLSGVIIGAKLIRKYPYGKYTAHIVGHTGLMSKHEQQLLQGNYLTNQHVGKNGIEKYYEKLLHGELGYRQVEINARGKIIRERYYQSPQRGNDLTLTIDIDLQQAIYEMLADYKACAIVAHAKTGEILAMVNTPNYDANIMIDGNSKQITKINNDPKKPIFDRAVQGLYPLASIIKPFIALHGLEKKKINSKYEIFCRGWYELEGSKHIFRDISFDAGGNGWVNLHKSLVSSSDTYYYHLAGMLGIQEIHNILTKFGFGNKTNIDLPREKSGLVPTKQWKLTNKGEPWYKGDTLLTGIGQGFLQVTPIQMLQATILLANKGTGARPHLLKSYLDNNYDTQNIPLTTLEPIKLSNHKYWQMVHKGMQGVIMEPGGTGWRFGKDAPYSAAGKTGTAQIISLHHNSKIDKNNIPEHLKDHSYFVAFAPIKEPEIVVVVLLENTSGAPIIARKIMDLYFANPQIINNTNKNIKK